MLKIRLKIIKYDFYLDDLMSGADTLVETKQLMQEVSDICIAGGFHLRKWSANDLNVLESIPPSLKTKKYKEYNKDKKMIFVLSISNLPMIGSFTFKVEFPSSPLRH